MYSFQSLWIPFSSCTWLGSWVRPKLYYSRRAERDAAEYSRENNFPEKRESRALKIYKRENMPWLFTSILEASSWRKLVSRVEIGLLEEVYNISDYILWTMFPFDSVSFFSKSLWNSMRANSWDFGENFHLVGKQFLECETIRLRNLHFLIKKSCLIWKVHEIHKPIVYRMTLRGVRSRVIETVQNSKLLSKGKLEISQEILSQRELFSVIYSRGFKHRVITKRKNLPAHPHWDSFLLNLSEIHLTLNEPRKFNSIRPGQAEK